MLPVLARSVRLSGALISGILFFIVLCLFTFLPEGRADTWVDDAFGEATEPVQNRSMKPSDQITGVFPKDWMEDSSNGTKVSANCTPNEEDGIRFLRINVKDMAENGRVQFCRILSPIQQEIYYHLRMKVCGMKRGLTRSGQRATTLTRKVSRPTPIKP